MKNVVCLEWKTATESNNKGFEIQRELDKGWESVDFIQGAGTSTEVRVYQYSDSYEFKSYKGDIKYRLKQVDFNGSSDYSDEINITVDFVPKKFMLFPEFPKSF